MSDQPTTGEGEQLDIVDAVAKYGIKKLQPTGEWTMQQAQMIAGATRGTTIDAVIEQLRLAHNAALAAERQKLEDSQTAGATLMRHNQQLREQLAAELEAGQKLIRMHTEAVKICNQLREQLAAEQQNAEKAAVRAEQAQIQLAAAMEALKAIRSWTKTGGAVVSDDLVIVIDAALAKIGVSNVRQ